MTTNQHTSIAWLPAISGAGLACGAVALLTADAFQSGHLTVTHALQPLLVLGAIAAAVQAHRSLSTWRPVSALALVVLAVLGSLATIYGTLGRQADTRDQKIADAVATNRQLTIVSEALATAKADAGRECKSGFGQRCTNAQARVDKLTADMAGQRTASPDPRADAIADLLHLVASADKARTRAIVSAIDPLVLPLFLELGSILFFAVAFPARRTVARQVSVETVERVAKAFNRDDALRDFRALKASNSQSFLADRWQVSEGTVSKWLAAWESVGAIQRKRDGRMKAAALALPAPRRS